MLSVREPDDLRTLLTCALLVAAACSCSSRADVPSMAADAALAADRAGAGADASPDAGVGADAGLDCFSPSQNLDKLALDGVSGCPCELEGSSVCVESQRLYCSRYLARDLVWRVEASCLELDKTCAHGEVRATAEACLAEFEECFQLQQGGFCGARCAVPLDCTAQICVSYSPATCGRGPSREGRCGDVRYRVVSSGFTSSSHYWDVATGELLAIVETTDTNSYCDRTSFKITHGDPGVVRACKLAMGEVTEVCAR
jgi:hypothetical protein